MQNEVWQDVEKFEGEYQVSNMGRVRSTVQKLPMAVLHGEREQKEVLHQGVASKGLMYVVLRHRNESREGKQLARRFYVKELVAEAFVGPAPAGMEARHANGDKSDNRLSNLCFYPKEERVGQKLTAKDVEDIRASAFKQVVLAKMYNVTQGAISQIIHSKIWKMA